MITVIKPNEHPSRDTTEVIWTILEHRPTSKQEFQHFCPAGSTEEFFQFGKWRQNHSIKEQAELYY